jgi:carbonic anhydrase/acetyltransferase-like protein (isoleucine patch superfamily)
MTDSRSYAFDGETPTIDDGAYVSREATLVGNVIVEADASVWPGVVLRGDVDPVRVGVESHVGDNATIHASTLGDRVMIGHGAVLNEATVEDGSLVGFNATLNSRVHVGEGSIIASGTVVPEDREIPPESFVRGVPARTSSIEEVDVDPEAIFEEHSSGAYTNLAARHDDLFE